MMQEAITISYTRLYRDLLVFVYRKVKNKSTAEDIVQDVFVKVHNKSHQLKEGEKILGWIYQIARNAVADHFRKNAKVLEPVNLDWGADYHEFNDCVAYCLQQLMQTLPSKYRVALELTELENLSKVELSRQLNISHSGARSRVQRARKMLREKLNALYHIKTDVYGNVIVCENRSPCCCSKDC
jgi:RNA polymerase sigma-70 factor, ECF subfamily